MRRRARNLEVGTLGALGAALLVAAMATVSFPAGLAGQSAASSTAPDFDGTTRVMIRVVSHDAKIIGSGVGGARITVSDARTGDVLARGVQEGGTGDTRTIVTEPRVRRESVYDTDGAAGFVAELELERPTRVRIDGEGPLGTTHATQRASRTLLLVPGQDVLGDGIVLELYGFTVELLEPGGGLSGVAGRDVPVRARVTMLCGCPTEPGGIWDSSEYTIEARVVQDGKVLETAPLEFSGETSVYEGRIAVPSAVSTEGLSLQVIAMDSAKGNFGMVERRFDDPGTGQSSD